MEWGHAVTVWLVYLSSPRDDVADCKLSTGESGPMNSLRVSKINRVDVDPEVLEVRDRKGLVPLSSYMNHVDSKSVNSKHVGSMLYQ